MDATPVLFDLPPVAEDPPRGAIRAKILAFLDQPRSAREIATHIERTVPNATGHLRAAGKLGLVVRIDWGRYVRADRCEKVPAHETIRRPNSDLDILIGAAKQATTLDELIRLTGRPAGRLRRAADRLATKGTPVPAHIASALAAKT